MQILEAASSAKRGRLKPRSSTAQPAAAASGGPRREVWSLRHWCVRGREPGGRGTDGPGAMVGGDSREGTGGGEAQVRWIWGKALSGRVAWEQGRACEADW